MQVEIQIALNFFISFLYNKLPRRRVNQFGEELEKALKVKFQGHWSPEKPLKGSAFRCLKTIVPLDPVFEIAAQESGMALADVQENLPEELSIWIDPGEVSYKMGEKGIVKILYREMMEQHANISSPEEDREIYRTFNPEAQCFKPIDSVASQLASLSLSHQNSGSSTSSSPYSTSSPSPPFTPSPCNGFMTKMTTPVTFTTAMFAQTKFGSTKLKNNGKRSQRMSPTEFSSYIKQRSMLQQQQQQSPGNLFSSAAQQRPRSLSPTPAHNDFLLLANLQQQQQQQQSPFAAAHFSPRSSLYDSFDAFGGHNKTTRQQQQPLFFDKGPFGHVGSPSPVASLHNGSAAASFKSAAAPSEGKGFSGVIDNYSVGGMTYPNQHLLMAN